MTTHTMFTRDIGSYPTQNGYTNKPIKIFKVGKSKNHIKNFTAAVALMQTGGIVTNLFTEEDVEHIKKAWKNDQENQDFITQIEPGVPFIQYHDELEKSIPDFALEVLITSHIGHIKKGHLFIGFPEVIVDGGFDQAAEEHGAEKVIATLNAVYNCYLYPRQKALLGFEKGLKEWMTDSVYESYPSLLTRLDTLLAQSKDV